MNGIQSVIEVIKKRVSVRSYAETQVEEEKQKQLTAFMDSNIKGPFGNDVRFWLLDLNEAERSEIKSLSTYGVIQNARLFIVGTVKDHPKAMEDFGYCMEKNILEATSLGLGTCWLGGTFTRSSFARKIGLFEDELLPAISPLGYARGKKTPLEKMMRMIAGSKTRKPWKELFHDGNTSVPLSREIAEDYATPLECVRLAPSASNKQPWRIIKDAGKNDYHFYLKRTPGYSQLFGRIQLQNIDMGIAMCHFELAVIELGLSGRWTAAKPDLAAADMEYIISWYSQS
jgi:nitroreductase